MLSILFLSVFLPWRAASCVASSAFGAPAAQIICKADTASGHGRLVSLPGAPEHSDCPVCFGLAGLQLAIVTMALLGFALGRFSDAVHFPPSRRLDGRTGLLRSSRAPPLAP